MDRLLKTETKGGQIMLDVEGEVYDVLIKEVDYDAMANQVVEIDFQALVSNEKVHSVAEIIFENHDKVEAGVLQEVLKEVSYRALPAALVEKVKVDVGEMEIGDTIRVKDLSIAKDKDVDIPVSYTHLFGRDKDGRIIAGFYAGRTHHIVEAEDCLLGCLLYTSRDSRERTIGWGDTLFAYDGSISVRGSVPANGGSGTK